MAVSYDTDWPPAFDSDTLFINSLLQTPEPPLIFDSDVFDHLLLPQQQPDYPQRQVLCGDDGEFWSGFLNPTRETPQKISAQSVAARQRRRKITEKTQELGRLVPGGHKMNTAEMLQSAHKYIRFLQAQVAILGFVTAMEVEEQEEEFLLLLQAHLLQSPLIQEKLYSCEKCIAPSTFMAKHHIPLH